MLKRIVGLCILVAVLVLVPVDTLASSGQSVGATGWNGDGMVLSSITITFNTSFPDSPVVNTGDKAKALEIFAMGNRLYSSELLRGKDVIMSVYVMGGAFGDKPDEIAGTIYIKNLYQNNQEIVGYSAEILSPR